VVVLLRGNRPRKTPKFQTMVNSTLCSCLTPIRHGTAHPPLVDAGDVLAVEGAGWRRYVNKVAGTPFYL
jgi:hypothetical protein